MLVVCVTIDDLHPNTPVKVTTVDGVRMAYKADNVAPDGVVFRSIAMLGEVYSKYGACSVMLNSAA